MNQLTTKVFSLYEEQQEEIKKCVPRIQLLIELAIVALDYQPKPEFKKTDLEDQMQFTLSKKQGEFFKSLESGKYRYLMLGGGFNSAKTVLLCFIFVCYALKNPGSRYAIMRKEMTNFRRTTFVSFLEANFNPLALFFNERRFFSLAFGLLAFNNALIKELD